MDYDILTLDDRFSVQREYQRERNLRIGNVRTDDAGSYVCKLSQHGTLTTVKLIVNGIYAPQMLCGLAFLTFCSRALIFKGKR